MDVRKEVNRLIKRHETNNPFKIAKQLEINIVTMELGNIRGFYKKILKRKYIFINSNLNELEKNIVCAHELAHAIFHSTRDIQFMLDNTNLVKKSKLENQANLFALLLVFNNDNYFLEKDYLNLKDWVNKTK